MAHGLNAMLKRGSNTMGCKSEGKTGIGSRRIFAPQFKLQVLDSYRNDADCKGNQRATARKYGIHRRQIQKWLQVENNLRNSVIKSKCGELIVSPEARKCRIELALRSAEHRQRDDVCSEAYSRRQRQVETEAELEHESALRIGGPEAREAAAVDKRVPDIPQQHSPATVALTLATTTLRQHYEWHDTSSRSGSERDDAEPFVSHCSPSSPRPLCTSAVALAPARTSPVPPACPVSVPIPTTTPFKCECPEPSPLPLDFTTHSRRSLGPDSPRGATTCMRLSPLPPAPMPIALDNDSAAPMDLSLKKSYEPLYPRASPDLHAPVSVAVCLRGAVALTPPAPHIPLVAHSLDCPQSLPLPLPLVDSDTQIWDLSTKGVKRPRADDIINASSNSTDINTASPAAVSDSVAAATATSGSRPIKLFKPYLDHVIDERPNSSVNGVDVKPVIVATIDNGSNAYSDSEHYIFNNNNNAEFKMEYSSSFYKDENYHHDDTARHINFYYPNGGLHFVGSTIHYDDVRNPFGFSKNANCMKQRQSYSLDFKLSAIECYYSDAVCRGNQRAVASKFKIHRRQVQKWLKQEDQLRQRNETTKPIQMHIVR